MISYEADGRVVLQGDADPSRTQTIPAGTARADQDKAIEAFFAQDAGSSDPPAV